jgi:hypothetical protein
MPKSKIDKITKDTTLAKILEKKGANEVLSKNNVPCMTCAMAHMELGMLKLGDVCNMYGLDLNKILKDLAKLK